MKSCSAQRLRRTLFTLGILIFGVFGTQAQTVPSVRQDQARISDAARTNPLSSPILTEAATSTTPVDAEPAPQSPGDPDIGEQWILRENNLYEAFTLGASTAIMTTDNVALTRSGELSDSYLLSQVSAGWMPVLGKNFFGQVFARYEWYRYDEFEVLDFDALNTGAGLFWISTKIQGLSAYGRYSFNQLYTSSGDDFYTSHGFEGGVLKIFPISRAHRWYLGASADLSFDAEPDITRRNEYRISAGYKAELTRWLSADLILQSALINYSEQSRNDFNQIGILSFSATPWEWLTFTATANYVINRSELEVFDYDAGSLGALLGATIRF